jgi:hypothetical protein
MGFSFITAQEMENLYELIANGIHRLGIPKCWLSLFEGEGRVSEYSRLQLTVEQNSHAAYGAPGLRYRTKKLLPEGFLDRNAGSHVILLALHFDREVIGILVFEHALHAPHVHEEFRDYVAVAIKVATLAERVRDHQRELEREVQRKTLRLIESNRKLKKEAVRRRLLENEVIHISAEVMERVGRDLHDGLSQKLAALSMFASALEGRLSAESHPGASTAGEIVGFLNETVADSKNVAHVEIELVDAEGRRVPRRDVALAVEVRGQGRLLGLDSGELAHSEGYKEGHITTFDGYCLALVQAIREDGGIELEATAEVSGEAMRTLLRIPARIPKERGKTL